MNPSVMEGFFVDHDDRDCESDFMPLRTRSSDGFCKKVKNINSRGKLNFIFRIVKGFTPQKKY